MLVQADLRQFPAHSERHEKHAEHVVIEVAHAGCLRRRDAARPCEAAVPCISVTSTTAARLRPCQKVRPWPHFWAARIYMKSVPCGKAKMPALHVLKVRGGDERFHLSTKRLPFFVQWLVRQGWRGEIELEGPDEAAELAVETALDADTASLKRLLANCGLEPSSLEGTWMDELKPDLQDELREKFCEFLQPEVLRRCCVRSTTTTTVVVKKVVTFVLDEDNWGWA